LSVTIKKSGKIRLILGLRHVNQFPYKCRFRCEDFSVAKEILNPGDFMFTFDLKSGYHHVEIFPEHRKYQSFAWAFYSGRTRFFQSVSVLPFGLSSAPYLFTKLLKPLVKKWRSAAKLIVVYLDDGIGAAASKTMGKNKAKIATSIRVFFPMKPNVFGSPLRLLLSSEPFSTLSLLKFLPPTRTLSVYKKT